MGNMTDKTGDRLGTGKHYVYFISDAEGISVTGRLRKMDAGREIARYICKSLKKSSLMKYTEYDGSAVSADTVGIIFQTHTWGSSLAVYSFLRHLRVSQGTYVYAVAVGETLSGDAYDTAARRLRPLEELRRIFVRRGLGSGDDIYVRCIDKKDGVFSASDDTSDTKIGEIMNNLFFYSMNELTHNFADTYDYVRVKPTVAAALDTGSRNKRAINNVYLDDDMMSGVRLCRVM